MTGTPSEPTYRWPEEDKLGRKKDADILLRFIAGKLEQRDKAGLTRSYVLNLDSQWGSGKTFFLKNLKDQITANGQVAVYVDAWQDDHSNDPFMAVVSGIEEELKSVINDEDAFSGVKDAVRPFVSNTLKVLGSGVKSGLVYAAKRQFGQDALDKLGEVFSAEGDDDDDILARNAAILKATNSAIDAAGVAISSSFSASKQARASFRQNLEELTRELGKLDSIRMPVFVLIDELDRCRPSYAVELLEEVKHLFNVENMVFILATDTEQLAHAVSGVYGSSFDGRRYLSRFIDRTYRFREADIGSFVEYCLHMNGLSENDFTLPGTLKVFVFLSNAFKHANASLRYIEQIVDYLSTFTATWGHENLKINLILLFDLAVRAHPESVKLDGSKPEALKAIYRFGSSRLNHKDTEISIERMVLIIKDYSASAIDRSAPDLFHEWVLQTVRNESITMNLHNKGLAGEYPRMFQDMLSVRDTLADD
ncbi:hypothetical protein OA238_c38090 [Octadecabacter arcticus 238]|uniref:KAP NTPase domain-containing protein n=1 Tax=Octadecabacter arcticus 238 TaxID=391616 RepID=M9RTC7_9RHOB|nr:P-loop NTPase fold protein [Octadecabacter arcticus]AGI73756.1 hypothetical protein OA238_c38090 [Octadecabacter arcticus 238]